jgi:hypothetical protein
MTAQSRSGLLAGLALAIVFAIAPIAVGAPSPGGGNLLLNGNFAKGSGTSPDDWRSQAWNNGPDTQYQWIAPIAGQPGQLEVSSKVANDARWMQSIALTAGWYHIATDVRAVNVPDGKTGANISLLEDGIMSRDLHGSTGWQRVGFYVKVGSHGADVDVALRVGGFSNLNSGTAFFRNAAITRVDQPPPGAVQVFDLAAIRQASASVPIGQPWTLAAAFILLTIAAYLGWRTYGEATINVTQVSPPLSPATGTSGKRRKRKRRGNG